MNNTIHRISEFLVGLLFGLGLILSGMTDPGKVIGFLDLFGSWDPSLALVMGGAIAVGFFAFSLAKKRTMNFLGGLLRLPNSQVIDRRLVIGSLMFGAGWGIAGFCPGPALVSMAAGLFHGDADVAGTMTSGGTESIMMAVKAARDFAKKTRGITSPELVVPCTIHPAFDKAAHYFGVKILHAKMGPDFRVDLADMERLTQKDIQRVLRDVEQADLAISVKSASETLRRAIYGAMSKRAAESLKEEMEILGPTRSKDVEAAQDRIIALVMQLSESGEIDISPEDSSESGG
jgi:hypothetical protein